MIYGKVIQKPLEMVIGWDIIISPAIRNCRIYLTLYKAQSQCVIAGIPCKFKSGCIIHGMSCAIQIKILLFHLLSIYVHRTYFGSMVICTYYVGPFLCQQAIYSCSTTCYQVFAECPTLPGTIVLGISYAIKPQVL